MDLDLNSHKSRGLKHVKNKRRFKPKTVIEQQQRKENIDIEVNEEKQLLQSNSSRYEEFEDDNDSELSSTNFAILAETPISKGGHFQFKRDKISDTEIDENQLFKLDLNLITKSLLTFPLTKRCDIPEEYFTPEELQAIESRAAAKKNEYLEYLSKTTEKIKTDKRETNDGEGQKGNETATDKLTEKVCNDEMAVSNTEKQNLEEWLDDFLDS